MKEVGGKQWVEQTSGLSKQVNQGCTIQGLGSWPTSQHIARLHHL
jgi:hypothetical protein